MKATRLGLACAVAAVGCGRIDYDPVAGPWWDGDWARRVRLDLDNAARAEALDDVPVLVRLTADRFDRTAASATGADLRFVDGDGTTVLPYEIEAWADPAVVWVAVPRIDAASASDHLWLYYGNPAATAPGRDAEVWSAAFVGVYHLGDPADATLPHDDGVDRGTTSVAGVIGPGRGFDAAAEHAIVIPDDPARPALVDDLTLSGWSRHRDIDGATGLWRALIARSTSAGTDANDFWLGFHDGSFWAELSTSTGERQVVRGRPAPLDTWLYVTMTITGGAVTLYQFTDQVELEPSTGVLVGGPALTRSPRPIVLGADVGLPGGATPTIDFVDGALDEVRLERVARSRAWVEVQHASMTDRLITYVPDR